MGSTSSPLSMVPYIYALNDPVNLTDPAGLMPSKTWFDIKQQQWANTAFTLESLLVAKGFLGANNKRLDWNNTYDSNTRRAHENYYLFREAIGKGYNPKGLTDTSFGSAWKLSSKKELKAEFMNKDVDVKHMQRFLRDKGLFEPRLVTGSFGSITRASLVKFMSTGTGNDGTVYALASTDSTRLIDEQQKANAQYIYDYLSNEGWSKEAICGLLGNIQQESHLNPGVWQSFHNTELGYGLVQWDDATKFLDWAKLNEDKADNMAQNDPKQLMDLQLEYLIWSSRSTTPVINREWFATTDYDSV
jgi:hypothetical protein